MALKTIIVALSNSDSDINSLFQALTELRLEAETRVILSHVVPMEKSDLYREVARPNSEQKKN